MGRTETAPWTAAAEEIAGVLAKVNAEDMTPAVSFFDRPSGRWYFTGQGRSGLVGRMAAMRFMHLGHTTHVVGEASAPAVGQGDHVVALSNSGSTAVTLHVARLATKYGADLLAVCSRPDSELARLATATLVVPVTTSAQFGGSLFEQCALILLDALILQLTADDTDSYRRMAERHANLE